MVEKQQTYANHARFVTGYHRIAFPLLALYAFWAIYRAVTVFSIDTFMTMLMAIGLLLVTFYARSFALRVQDRVIRLEMRMRLRETLPANLHARISELTPGQLVALRFASDAELPALCTKVLDERIQHGKAIKQLIRDWQGDYMRA
jgi:Family of unknown function (DUF6526)